ncbi:uncharacterized protein LOC129284946 isoform X1 [Prosopis cineraria]|uniref:uncharacterized protein LOC129284946 isoform X1 n=1 Tax=Prosopis cineraria TaxID=364024 RepID=UPI00240F1ED8|nr:uncharacterized protein LOC129284946 isoform X1 [Prosopis cineraria]
MSSPSINIQSILCPTTRPHPRTHQGSNNSTKPGLESQMPRVSFPPVDDDGSFRPVPQVQKRYFMHDFDLDFIFLQLDEACVVDNGVKWFDVKEELLMDVVAPAGFVL